jgi:putative alpha-1,2-mannosidase
MKLFDYHIFLILFVLFNNGCNLSTETGTIVPEGDLLDYVDPFIGTGFHGHTFPGPVLPYGMVQLSPDIPI